MEKNDSQLVYPPERYVSQVLTFQFLGSAYYLIAYVIALLTRFYTRDYWQGTFCILICGFIGYWIGLSIFRAAKTTINVHEKGIFAPWTWIWALLWTLANWGGYSLLNWMLSTSFWWLALVTMLVILTLAILLTPAVFRLIIRKQTGIIIAKNLLRTIGL
ncbi:hypothetical protein FWH30_03110 [Microgenomates group bacterium]|nr:hypothetical protein [Microgenomates group bacterium]